LPNRLQGQLLHLAKVTGQRVAVNAQATHQWMLMPKGRAAGVSFPWRLRRGVRNMVRPHRPPRSIAMSVVTPASPPTLQIVKMDQGGVNERILAKETKADFRRIEAASIKMPARFTSAEGKRFFVRLFSTLQLNAHFISVIARTRLDHDDIAKVEAALRERMEKVTNTLNKAIDGAEALFEANGITSVATYDTKALEIEVGVLSSSGRRYLEVLGKFDQLMPLLQTLEIHEVITTQTVDIQRAGLKRQVRDVANAARNFASGLRRRMNAGSPSEAEARPIRVAEQERGDGSPDEGAADAAEVGEAVPAPAAEAHAVETGAETIQ
jgi:hypothetical protein